MAAPIRGANGATPLAVYQTPAAFDFALYTVTFLLHCDGTATEHHALVEFVDGAGETVAVLKDWNVAPDGATVRYTFGVGLIPAACTVVDGEAVEHDLPDQLLAPLTSIVVHAVDEAGAAISGDNITACFLYADQFASDTSGTTTPPDTSPIYFVPGGVLV